MRKKTGSLVAIGGPPSHAEGGTGEPALESISAAQMYKVLGDS